MVQLVPVDRDPFAGAPKLSPVDHDPFALEMPASSAGNPDMSFTDRFKDALKSLGVGVAKGVVGLAGMPGDITEIANHGGDWVDEHALTPEQQAKIPSTFDERFSGRAANMFPTSGEIQKSVEGKTGAFYDPRTTIGQYAQTAGEFLPSIVGGPETLATRLATRVAAPAIASETAGQLTQGTAAEPWARLAGAVVGGGKAGMSARRAPPLEGPSLEAIEAARGADYAAVNKLGVTVRPAALQRDTQNIASALEGQGLDATIAPRTHKILETLGSRDTPATITQVDNARKVLGQLSRGATSSSSLERIEAGAARQAIEGIDDALPALQPGDLASGAQHHAQTIEHLTNARGNAQAAFKLNALDRAQYNAANNAAAANSGANGENALRQQLKSIINSPSRAAQFSAAERTKMQAIVRGEGARNAVRTAGNLLGGGGGLGAVIAGGAGHMALPGVGLAVPLVGRALKAAGNKVTQSRLGDLTNDIALNSPLGKAIPRVPGKQTLSAPELAALNALFAVPQKWRADP